MATHEEMQLLVACKEDRAQDVNFKEWFTELLGRREGNLGEEFKCAWCGATTVRTRKDKKFCNTKCRNDFHRLAPAALKELELK